MSMASSLPKAVCTFSTTSLSHAGSIPVPPPTPDHSHIRSTPEAEDSDAYKAHVGGADPSLVHNSTLGLRSGLQCVDKGLDNRGGANLLAKLNPAMVLQNSGSVARDHLASERTFLAYVRTSLTIATTGVGK
jgi:Domain of unknown function (DUF202)